MRPVSSALVLLALSGAAWPWGAQAQDADADDAVAAPTEAAPPSRVPLEEIQRYVAVYNAIKQGYVDPVDDHKLMQSAVRGLLLEEALTPMVSELLPSWAPA